jgi:hypothetical protein
MSALPLIFIFWFVVATYVIHVLDESLLGGSFVEKVRTHWWPEYSWLKFFWFNTSYFVIMIASVVAYDYLGGAWVILPLAWTLERAANGFWHLWWTIRFRGYSPSLVTSILMWMSPYFLFRYTLPTANLTATDWSVSIVIAAVATVFLSVTFPLIHAFRKAR